MKLFCIECGFRKGYNPMPARTPSPSSMEQPHDQKISDQNIQPLYNPYASHSVSQPEPSPIAQPSTRPRFDSMADFRRRQSTEEAAIQQALKSIHLNYQIGEEVFYPKNYHELEQQLTRNHYDKSKLNLSTHRENPSHFGLGQVLAVHRNNYTVSLMDNTLNTTITVHAALIYKFQWQEYSQYRRGVSVNFYDEERLQWNSGRIESILADDKTVGISYGYHDDFKLLPIYYVKPYEELKEDEWSEASDFVFREYVRDVATELAKKSMDANGDEDIVIDVDEFRAAMEKLGIRSLTSRNKAFEIFDQIKQEIIYQQLQVEENTAATMQLLMNEGHMIGSYQCCGYCQQHRQSDGVCLTNCNHAICKTDFQRLMDNVIQSAATLKCPQCGADINPIDIQRHGRHNQYAVITQLQLDSVQQQFGGGLGMINYEDYTTAKCLSCAQENDIMKGLQQFVCIFCQMDNCLKCNKAHRMEQSCEEYRRRTANNNNASPLQQPQNPFMMMMNQQQINNGGGRQHAFRSRWTHDHASDPRHNQAVLTNVMKNSAEWTSIIQQMKYAPDKIVQIQRVENEQLWQKYSAYSAGLGGQLKEVEVWHGTRNTDPSMIYHTGFLKEKARVGGCLWFAVNSSYSMNGFQHPIQNGQFQLFLCLVAGGNPQHVKYIRSNKILNVYKNEAAYPAYLITYR